MIYNYTISDMNIKKIMRSLAVDFHEPFCSNEVYQLICDLGSDPTSYFSMLPGELVDNIIDNYLFGKEEYYEYTDSAKDLPEPGWHLLTYYFGEHPHLVIVDVTAGGMFKILYTFFSATMRFRECHLDVDHDNNHKLFLCMHSHYSKCIAAKHMIDKVVMQRIYPISDYRFNKIPEDRRDEGMCYLYACMWKTIEARDDESDESEGEEDSDDDDISDYANSSDVDRNEPPVNTVELPNDSDSSSEYQFHDSSYDESSTEDT